MDEGMINVEDATKEYVLINIVCFVRCWPTILWLCFVNLLENLMKALVWSLG